MVAFPAFIEVKGANVDEDILMQRVVEGDMQAFRRLVSVYQPRLLRFARRMLPTDRTLAEDVVQEAFVRLWCARSRYRPEGQLGCFLFRIVHNLCLDALRDAPSDTLAGNGGGVCPPQTGASTSRRKPAPWRTPCAAPSRNCRNGSAACLSEPL